MLVKASGNPKLTARDFTLSYIHDSAFLGSSPFPCVSVGPVALGTSGLPPRHRTTIELIGKPRTLNRTRTRAVPQQVNGYNASIAEVTELWSTYMRNVTWNLKNQNELHPPV